MGKHIKKKHEANDMTQSDVIAFNVKNKDKMWGGFQDIPITIQEKLRFLNIYDVPWSDKYDIPLKSVCADKLRVKEYAQEKLGVDISIPTLFVYDDVGDINWDELPDKFVMKTNHNSGGNIICTDKSKLDIGDCKHKLKYWFNDDFTFRNGFESHYHWINRKIFVEEYKNDGHLDLNDYKFLCFNGLPRFIQVINGRHESHRHLNYYNTNFDLVNLSRLDFPNNHNILDDKPTSLTTMMEYAYKLCKDFKFVRVDFYEIDNTPYLGELTFTPGANVFKYSINEHNKIIGDILHI